MPAYLDPKDGEPTLFIEKGHALDKAGNLFGSGIESWRRSAHPDWSLPACSSP
jgi:hypothetical protein